MTTFTAEQRQRIATYMAQSAVKVVCATQYFLIQERGQQVVVFWRTYRAFGRHTDESCASRSVAAAIRFVEQTMTSDVRRIECYR